MASGLKHALDALAYTVSAAVLVGGLVYGVHRLRGGPPPLPPVVAATPAAPPAPPPAKPAPAPPAAPDNPPAPADSGISSAPVTPAPPAPPAGGVLTTATGSYVLPAPTSSVEQDRSTFLALQRNCYDAAANNQNGQYPALQTAACNRYAQFAGDHGWDPGPMPTYGQAPAATAEPAAAAPQAPYQGEPQPSEIVIYNAAGADDRHRHPPPPPGQTPRQIGPNYPLPPPQPQPPVSQEQRRSGNSRTTTPDYPPR